MTKNYEYFLRADLERYAGKWVAIVNQKVAASGEDAVSVYNEARMKFPSERPSMAKVPTGEALILVVGWP